MQALTGIANQLGQARLDVQVHIFQIQLPLKVAGFDVIRDLRHAALDGCVVVGADDALGRQHLGVGQTARNIYLPQALVKKHAGGVAFDQITHGFRE